MNLFKSPTCLKHQYSEVLYSKLSGTGAANAVLSHTFYGTSRMAFLDNATNADIHVYLVHPDLDGSVTDNRIFWLELGASRVINYDTFGGFLRFDSKTNIYIANAGSAPTAGKVRIISW